jgi:hypothetical protein
MVQMSRVPMDEEQTSSVMHPPAGLSVEKHSRSSMFPGIALWASQITTSNSTALKERDEKTPSSTVRVHIDDASAAQQA